jgi:galactoside O-acetyltransferase
MLQSKYLTEVDLKDFGFKSLGRNVKISSDARIYGPRNISIADDVRIDDFCTLNAFSGWISIGCNVLIARGCHLSGALGIEFKDFAGLAANGVIYSSSDDYTGDYLTGQTIPKKYIKIRGGTVTLDRHVIVGSSCTLLGPCHIGEGSSVGAMSLVHKDLDPWGMYVGIPAKRLKDRKRGLLVLEQEYLKEKARGDQET